MLAGRFDFYGQTKNTFLLKSKTCRKRLSDLNFRSGLF